MVRALGLGRRLAGWAVAVVLMAWSVLLLAWAVLYGAILPHAFSVRRRWVFPRPRAALRLPWAVLPSTFGAKQ